MESNGPFVVRHDASVNLWDVVFTDYTVPCNSKEQAENMAHHLNCAWHSRDTELATKDARILELEAEKKELEKYINKSLCSCNPVTNFVCFNCKVDRHTKGGE